MAIRHHLCLPELSAQSHAPITLSNERSHYLSNVLRMKSGERLIAFDGAGHEWDAIVELRGRRHCELILSGEARFIEPPRHALRLLLGQIKGEAMDRAIARAVELGATRISPLNAERSNVKLNAERAHKKQQHWRRLIESACEQCGQRHLPALDPPTDLGSVTFEAHHLIVLHPDGEPFPKSLEPADTLLCIGPEGGWTETELNFFARSGALQASLGALVLRAETAPLAALAAVRAAWGWR